MIDWNGALEAVHTDGRVVSVKLSASQDQPDEQGHYALEAGLVGSRGRFFHEDGAAYAPDIGWTIRNVVEQPAWRTSAEQLDRMDALVQRLAARTDTGLGSEARAILADREPVDPRFNKALAVIKTKAPLLADDAARRFARDILAALGA